MKRTLVVFAMLLFAGLAWAEGPETNDEPIADPGLGGGCVLPDLAGLSPDQIALAALEAGFQTTPMNVQAPACPVTFHCNSIGNCGIGPLCAIGNIGPCCSAGGGLNLCCINGNIWVKKCPCRCTGNPCSITCPNSTEVNWHCA